MNRRTANNSLRTVGKVVIVCLPICIAVLLAIGVDQDSESELAPSTTLTKSDELTYAITLPPGMSTSVEHPSLTAQPNDRLAISDLGPDRPENLWGFALSFADAKWMDRQGMPSPSDAYRAYRDLSLETLREMARHGDIQAAIIGSEKSWRDAWHNEVGLELAHAFDGAGAATVIGSMQLDAGIQERSRLVQRLFATPEWQQTRKFLWHAVVNGSSYAAKQMAASYMDIASVCYDVVQCDAWLLVAWRMGEWDVVLSTMYTPAPGEVANMGHALREANALWARINDERVQLGLPALKIDLHPSLDAWQGFRSGIEQPIFRR